MTDPAPDTPPLSPTPQVKPMVELHLADQLGNEYVVHAFPEAPYGLMDLIKNFNAKADAAMQVDAINAIMTMAFPADESEQLANLARSPGGPSMTAMMGLFADLMEAWFGRPTGGFSGSQSSDGPMSTASEDASSSREATPPPLPPRTGLQPVIT